MGHHDLTPLTVEVIHATPGSQVLHRVQVVPGTTLAQAVEAAGLGALLADEAVRIGVFGRLGSASDEACEGDRIEIYRELLADPKATRRRRAAQATKLRGDARPG